MKSNKIDVIIIALFAFVMILFILVFVGLKNENKAIKFYMIENATVSAYSPSIEETNENPSNTAIMEKPVIGYTCAVSRDLKYILGNKIYIEQLGVFKVNDLMNKRYENCVDLCMNKENAIKFGKQKHDIVILDRIR